MEVLQYISQGANPAAHLKNIELACQNGIDWVQLRLKNVSEAVVLSTAQQAKQITDKYQVKLVINDHYQVAAAVNAHGVHLGKSDARPLEARKALGAHQIIGGTANTLADCLDLADQKVDYIGLGPFRFTTTKNNLSPVLGREGYGTILKAFTPSIPIVAIGGITPNDIPDLMTTGISGIAISGTITRDFKVIPALKNTIHNALSTAGEQGNNNNI
jgi:thiamine-phosphate pyrophosphorylase